MVMEMKTIKTNAIRQLDKAKLNYEIYTYECDGFLEGTEVAKITNQNPDHVFKTLVCISPTKNYYVFLIPVACELDLKKCAKTVHEKHIELIHVNDLLKTTGYVRGGCSPIGMKKCFPTYIHESCLNLEKIIFSGGKLGIQIAMMPNDLIELIHAQTADLIA